ncbi:unnamed protein product [Effrenium voratum]|uniref:Uncharacterized protein n=1 Tax=Effrenium voratum TaxID=2562239 RepID=A0AA36HQA9_9DINO|nr:unnamed protein product [Effrenium voratum]
MKREEEDARLEADRQAEQARLQEERRRGEQRKREEGEAEQARLEEERRREEQTRRESADLLTEDQPRPARRRAGFSALVAQTTNVTESSSKGASEESPATVPADCQDSMRVPEGYQESMDKTPEPGEIPSVEALLAMLEGDQEAAPEPRAPQEEAAPEPRAPQEEAAPEPRAPQEAQAEAAPEPRAPQEATPEAPHPEQKWPNEVVPGARARRRKGFSSVLQALPAQNTEENAADAVPSMEEKADVVPSMEALLAMLGEDADA